jgi:hypothetical protein
MTIDREPQNHSEVGPRNGIIFWGEFPKYNRVKNIVGIRQPTFKLYVQEQKDPVFEFFGVTYLLQDQQGVDQFFHTFVAEGNFCEVRSSEVRYMLEVCKREKGEGISWDRKTYRFIPAIKSERDRVRTDLSSQLTFILTEDKQDINSFAFRP